LLVLINKKAYLTTVTLCTTVFFSLK